jgi:hypothetical protein
LSHHFGSLSNNIAPAIIAELLALGDALHLQRHWARFGNMAA